MTADTCVVQESVHTCSGQLDCDMCSIPVCSRHVQHFSKVLKGGVVSVYVYMCALKESGCESMNDYFHALRVTFGHGVQVWFCWGTRNPKKAPSVVENFILLAATVLQTL